MKKHCGDPRDRADEDQGPRTPLPSILVQPGRDLYAASDSKTLLMMEPMIASYRSLKTLDELLERDAQREKDGFKRKISMGKIVKPVQGGRKKFVIVPTTTEDKLYHDNRVPEDQESGEGRGKSGQQESQETGETTGTAEGEEGAVIGERPLYGEGEGEDGGVGAGSGEGDEHELSSSAYDLGKILTEKFQLPNLKDKGKKKVFTRYSYDLTDSNFGSGQVLDKKRTLKKIIKTNIHLGRFDPEHQDKTEDLLINPRDYIYRIMSREKDTESQAVVFFMRDYSGSMSGKPTELVCSQHVMIYSWLMFQYKEQVLSRFILHDTKAKEVPDFYTYHNMNVAGGTQIITAFSLVNEIVEKENLAADYNIYVFYGGDGDDWETDVKVYDRELNTMFEYVSRIGVTIIQSRYAGRNGTVFERFLKNQNILERHPDLIHLNVLSEDADDRRLVEGIKALVS